MRMTRTPCLALLVRELGRRRMRARCIRRYGSSVIVVCWLMKTAVSTRARPQATRFLHRFRGSCHATNVGVGLTNKGYGLSVSEVVVACPSTQAVGIPPSSPVSSRSSTRSSSTQQTTRLVGRPDRCTEHSRYRSTMRPWTPSRLILIGRRIRFRCTTAVGGSGRDAQEGGHHDPRADLRPSVRAEDAKPRS